jgi:hypothetical protein
LSISWISTAIVHDADDEVIINDSNTLGLKLTAHRNTSHKTKVDPACRAYTNAEGRYP